MLSQQAKEWLNNEFSYNNPYHINAETAWKILASAKRGDKISNEVWNEYRNKHRLPEAKEVNFKSFREFATYIYV